MQDTPKYHYMIREGSTMQSRYNPQKEYNLFPVSYTHLFIVSASWEIGISLLAGFPICNSSCNSLNRMGLVPIFPTTMPAALLAR